MIFRQFFNKIKDNTLKEDGSKLIDKESKKNSIKNLKRETATMLFNNNIIIASKQ